MSGSRAAVDVVREAVSGLEGPVAVTGATGWLGSVALDLLYGAFALEAPTRVVAFASTARDVTVADGRTARVHPLEALRTMAPAPQALLHLAFLTPDRMASLGADEYGRRNRSITEAVELAVRAYRPAWLVVASSGAVYGDAGARGAHPYVELKRDAEARLQAAADEVGATCVVPRIFSMAGPRLPRDGRYALGDLLAMAAEGGPLTVRAGHQVSRTYCGSDEVVALALWAAASGRSLVFDTGGELVELGDLACEVAKVHGLRADAVTRARSDGTPADVYAGDGRVMQALAEEAQLRLRSLAELIGEAVARPSATSTT
jgi:nucleoside-diphosphate-sugar epimerase